MYNSAVIASTAGCLADMLGQKLISNSFKVYTASNDKDLFIRINENYPKYIFIENCFRNMVTDEYVQKIKRNNRNLRIVIWTAAEITPFSAARFINAGAESFFSIREKSDDVNKIIKIILMGDTYCPDDVLKVCGVGTSFPIFDVPITNKELQVIKLMYLTDKQIAKELCMALNTLFFHKTNIFKKLGVNTRSAVIGWASENGISQYNK